MEKLYVSNGVSNLYMSLLQKGHCTAKHAKAAKKKQNHESFFKAVRVKV
jgi:hypothetical protein